MSANKKISRDLASGQGQHLQRMRPPLAQTLTLQLPPVRNPVAQALANRHSHGGAGKHLRSNGASRRAEAMALQKALRNLE